MSASVPTQVPIPVDDSAHRASPREGRATERGTSSRRLGAIGPILLVSLLLLSGGAVLLAPIAGAGHLNASSRPSAAALLQSARASAERGAGPWGPVAAPGIAHPLTSGPNLTFGVIMTYDAADGYVLAVSLNASSGAYNNSYGPSDLTWKFSTGNWSLVTTVGQVPATLSPGLVYDAKDEYVLLYGGRLMATGSSIAPVTNQTWSYHAGVWTNLSNTSNAAPFAVDFANPVYDAADGYVVLYNEIGITPTNPNGYLNTTWTYAGGTWTNVTATAGTPPQMLGAMTYDAADGYVLYFGGYTWWNQLTNATWSFQGGTWTNLSSSVAGAPSPRMSFGIDYDSARGAVILYGGLDQLYVFNGSQFSYQTWAYAGGHWTLLSSNGTIWSIQTMAYYPAGGDSVLLGANSSFLVPPNVVTWVFSGGSWSVAAPAFLYSHTGADVGQPFTLVVTQSPNAGGLVYRYSGLPPGCNDTGGASVLCVPTTPGSYVVSVDVTGAAGFHATASAAVVVNSAPSILSFTGSGPTGEVGIALNWQVNASLGTGSLTYAYVGLPPGCSSANASAIRCVPTVAGSYNLTATVTDALGVAASARQSLRVVAHLAVDAFALNRSVLDMGEPVSLSAALSGGDGPVLYAYSGLPAGCASVNANALECRPNAMGTFSVALVATDSLGATAQGAVEFQVNPLPSVLSVHASNDSVTEGGTVTIATAVAGGTAPFSFQYAGLPAGCSATDSPSLQCSALPVGNYTVAVTVTDATGARASGATSFTVLQTPVHPGPVKATPGSATPSALTFWVGLGIAALAVAGVALVGARQLYLRRQGTAIVRELERPVAGTSSGPTPDAEENSGPVGPGQ